jgi:ATP-binding cassette subfamily B protein
MVAPQASGERYPLLRCLAIYRDIPLLFLGTALLFVVVNAGLAWQQWLVGRAVDDVTKGVAAARGNDGVLDSSVLWRWLFVLAAVALARGMLQYAVGISSQLCNQRLLTTLRMRIFEQIQRLDLAYHRSHGMGELVTRTTRDADKVRDALVTFWRQGLETLLVVAASVGLLMWYHPLLGLVPLLLTIAGLCLFAWQTDQLVLLDRAVGAAYDRVNQDLSEGINGVRVIKSFVLEASRIERFTQQVGTFVAHARTALAYSSTRIPLPQIVVALSHVWILVYGAVLVSRGEIALGSLVASLLIVTTLIFRLEGVARAMQAFADARSSAQRIWELLDARPAVGGGTSALPSTALGVRFTRVSVTAPGSELRILNQCSLQIEPGEVVALVGATGAGKSTLASLLPNLLPADSGLVELGSDQAGWRATDSVPLVELRRRVHVAAQESFLFSDTLAANLRLGAPDASDAELLEALELACVADVLDTMPQGLHTRLGERGVTLSGGQRQRLCLARALLSDPDVLILDDATSALDAVTERAILNAMRRRHESRAHAQTLLLISSKLSTILFADRVLMLHQGRIVASGRHADLAVSNPLYRDLLGLDHDHG